MSFPGDSVVEDAAMFVGGYISEYPFKSRECQFTIFVAFLDIFPPSQKLRPGGVKRPGWGTKPRDGGGKLCHSGTKLHTLEVDLRHGGARLCHSGLTRR
jgi:hypothetical protein